MPAVTGRIALAIETFGFEEATYASCDGFASCFAGSARVTRTDRPDGAAVSASARSLVVFVCAAGALSFTGGCGGDDPPPLNMDLVVTANWHDEPSFVDQIGYELSVEAHLWERGSTCAPLPDLRWMVDGVEWAVGPIGARAGSTGTCGP